MSPLGAASHSTGRHFARRSMADRAERHGDRANGVRLPLGIYRSSSDNSRILLSWKMLFLDASSWCVTVKVPLESSEL